MHGVKNGAVAPGIVARFKQDVDIFRECMRRLERSSALERIMKRHLMHLVTNKQLLVGLEASQWTVSDALKDVMDRRAKAIISTQLVEDEFKVQKVDGTEEEMTVSGDHWLKVHKEMQDTIDADPALVLFIQASRVFEG